MKKIICALIATTLLLACGCNYTLIDTKWNFQYAYITVGGLTIEVEVEKWTEGQESVTITDINGVTYVISHNNVMFATERIR